MDGWEGSKVARVGRGCERAAGASLRLCAHLCPDLHLHLLSILLPEGLRVKVLARVFVVIPGLPHI